MHERSVHRCSAVGAASSGQAAQPPSSLALYARGASLVIVGACFLVLVGCSAVSSGGSSTNSSAKTDSIVAAADLGLEPDPVAGPFADLTDYCKLIAKDRDRRSCSRVVREVEQDLESPYQAVQVIEVNSPGTGTRYCEIAIRTEEGWFVTEELFICGESASDVEAEVITLELVMQKDSPSIVRAELRFEERDGKTTLMSEEVALCGVGADGVMCTKPFSRLEHVLHADGREEHRAVSMTLSRFGVLKVNGEAMVDGELIDVSGAYRIRFE